MNKYATEHFAKALYDDHYYGKDVLPLRYREGMTVEERKQWQRPIPNAVHRKTSTMITTESIKTLPTESMNMSRCPETVRWRK